MKKIDFIHASTVRSNEDISSAKTKTFIELFNKFIKTEQINQDGSFTLNTGIDFIPVLNTNEFKYVHELASAKGWVLTSYGDNYQTTTYKMVKI